MAHPDTVDLIETFNICIDRLHAGERIEDCLRDYPQYANTLRPMLELGQAVQRANPAVGLGARARVRANVMRALAQSGRVAPRRNPFAIHTQRLTLAAATLLIVAFAALLILTRGESPDNVVQPTETVTATATASATSTATQTATLTAAPTQTRTPSPVPTDASAPSRAPTQTRTPSLTPTPTQTQTLTPTATPTPSLTPTAEPCEFMVQVSSANLRNGPGTGYDVVGFGYEGDTFRVRARHTSNEWYLLEGDVWIAADVGALSGDCSGLDESDLPYIGGEDSGGGDSEATPDDAVATPDDDNGGGTVTGDDNGGGTITGDDNGGGTVPDDDSDDHNDDLGDVHSDD